FLDARPAQRDAVLGLIVGATAAQVLRHGVFHADPHPGNFLVVPGDGDAPPRLAILDFGCVERLDAEARRGYAAVVMAVAAGDDARLAAALQQMGFATRDGDPETLRRLAELMLEGVRPGSAGFAGIDPRQQMERMLEMVRENPVVEVPGHFVLLGRVLGAHGGLLMHYQPKLDLLQLLLPYLVTVG
ncbi:MAG TPA: AarF/UbiB family protein, partial [Kofleriaceae bacterium]|nr:AarF/UbiB family protein [Kofleriaceae bacterium]